ncbi:2059_t:CDS:2, partial [Funneliformis caledonium]
QKENLTKVCRMDPSSSVAAYHEFFKQQRQEIILNGCLPNCISSPIFLYHKDMANEYVNENSHKNAFINHITEFIGKLIEIKIEDGSSNYRILLVETAYATLLYSKYWVQKQRYNAKAHHLCVKKYLIPKLFCVSNINLEGWYMIVMKYINNKTLQTANITKEEYNDILKNIQEVINTLHTNDIIFSDLYSSNIMIEKVDRKLQVMLIDFDWVGIHQKDHYTPIMNPEIK